MHRTQSETVDEVDRIGSVERRGTKYRGKIYWAGKYRNTGSFDTEAEALRANAQAMAVATRNVPDGAHTLATYADAGKWWERRELDEKVIHVEKEKSCWRRHVLSHTIADVPLEDLLEVQIHDWVRDALRKPKVHWRGTELVELDERIGRGAIKHALSLVKRCLRDAMLRGHIAINPARDVELPRPTEIEDDKWTFLDQREIDAVHACAAIPLAWRLVYRVAIYTGLRRGELVALQWRDIDLQKGGLITVRRSLSAGRTKACKKRYVPLFDEAFDALLQWRALYEKRTGCKLGGDALVFPKIGGGMRREDDDFFWSRRYAITSRKDIEKNGGRKGVRIPGYRELAGVVRPVRFHDLRHTCASHLVIGTWGRKWVQLEVKELMGHSSIMVTERYTHLAREGIRAAALETATRADAGPLRLVK
jgi:integrase